MDTNRLKQAREKLGLGKRPEAPAADGLMDKVISDNLEALKKLAQTPVEHPVVKQPEPEAPKTEKLTGNERPLEGLDLLSQKLLAEVRASSPVHVHQVEPVAVQEPQAVAAPLLQQTKPKPEKPSPLPGLALGVAGLGLIGAGVSYGGRR